EEAIKLARDLYRLIEDKCTDKIGYLEAFDEDFNPIPNDKISENDVIADKTMNTLLHIFEAYTEFYRVFPSEGVGRRLEWILSTFAEKVYNPDRRRLDVFFDTEMKPIIDLHSYGHDIEAAWLIDRGVQVLSNRSYFIRMNPITATLTHEVHDKAFDGSSLSYEAVKGEVNETRVWWVQAEALVGFMHGLKREPHRTEYKDVVNSLWAFIKDYLIDGRVNSEWFSEVNSNGKPDMELPLVDMWKCPYHNGRMCFEVLKAEIEI
ncbi:MAG: AGE family epimerase/isomerase, partial [Lachnospiraceae bacterium]|nr:AGE family epimerase/isomerase [Lachnospiraceae bacterium]